jgi:hypothetical protein
MERITKAAQELKERADAIARIKQYVKPGDTVYTTIKHVARSGMCRWVQLYVYRKNKSGECVPIDLTWDAAIASGSKYDDKYEALEIGGCGMDVGFEAVYNMSRALWPHGYTCPGEKRCYANDHINGDRNYKRHLHHDGGYALRQRWQ